MAWTWTERSECDLQISSGRLCLDMLATAPVDLIGELVGAPSGNPAPGDLSALTDLFRVRSDVTYNKHEDS